MKDRLASSKDTARKILEDLRLAAGTKMPTPRATESTIKWKRRPSPRDIKHNTAPFSASRSLDGGDVTVHPAHDLAEVLKLQDIEPYFAVSVDRHVELIMKNGFQFRGKDPDTVRYVKKRIREIALLSGQPFADLIREYARNLVSTSNSLLVTARDRRRSSGVPTRMWGRRRDPIAYVSIPDPSSVFMRQTKSGLSKSYVQRLGGKKRTWPAHDVIHATWRKRSGFRFGVPYVIPVLEDIRALRKLEMLSEHVAHKHAFPLMHWKVGTEKHPADMVVDHATGAQMAEVDVANRYAEIMAQEGYVVTSERHEIRVVGAEGEALDLSPFIEHYELRVLAGLRLSQLDLGRGDTANRGTAKVLSQILADACKELQDIICNYLNDYLIDQLVMEGQFDLMEENRVELVFPAIDTEEERAHQAHWMQMYVNNLVTRAEARQHGLKLDEITDAEEEGLFLNKHLIPLAKAETAAKAALGAGGPSASKQSDNKSKKSTANKTTPANQHGSTTKRKITANDSMDAMWTNCGDQVVSLVKMEKDCRIALNQASRSIADILVPELEVLWHEAYERAAAAHGEEALREEDRDLHQLSILTQQFRQKDLQQVRSTCMLQAGIEVRTGLPRVADQTRALVVPALQTGRVQLAARVARMRRAAEVLGFMEGSRDAGKNNIEVSSALGVPMSLDIPDQTDDRAYKPLVLSNRLQSCSIGTTEDEEA